MSNPKTQSPVHKTYKLFIGGAFPRSESGRTLPIEGRAPKGAKGPVAQICRASRKDLRNAVEVARKAQPGWQKATGLLRGQILYRIAEMLAARSGEMEDLLCDYRLATPAQAQAEVQISAQRLLWYAGWCDKLSQVSGSVNAVNGPYFNFSMPEAQGVVAVLPPEKPCLLGLVSTLAPVLVPGNSAVVVSSIETGPVVMTFAEILATSDVPGGVVDLLSADREELVPTLASHRDINANFLACPGELDLMPMRLEASDHIKRSLDLPPHRLAWWKGPEAQSLGWIESFCEIKTAWHPMGY